MRGRMNKDLLISVDLGTSGSTCICSNLPYGNLTSRTLVTDHPYYGDWILEGYQTLVAGVFRRFRDEITRF